MRMAISVIRLSRQYHKALLNLHQFSHMLVFHNKEDRVAYQITQVVQVDEGHGFVIAGKMDVPNTTVVYDIKPYMPCEDRVRSAVCLEEKTAVFDQSRLSAHHRGPNAGYTGCRPAHHVYWYISLS